MPLFILVFFIADLLSITYPLIAYYLYREWTRYHGTLQDEYAQRCLYGAIALLLLIVFGKFLITALLSKNRKDEDEPRRFDTSNRELLRRPDGTLIHIEHYGPQDAQSIIFIHGLNANSKNWYYQRKHFEKNFRLILMDLPGMGRSTRPPDKDLTMDKLAGHLGAVIAHTGAKDPILWGHSMGGMTILNFLARGTQVHCSSVKGAILQHTTYTNPLRTIIFRKLAMAIQKPVLIPLCYLMIIFSPLIWVFRWMSYLNGSSHLINRFITFAGTQTSRQLEFCTLLSTLTPPAITARGCLAMFRYDVTGSLNRITTPTLVIAADGDVLTMPDASVYMQEHIPNATMVMLTPANHQGLMERHKEVNEAAFRFIQRLRSKES